MIKTITDEEVVQKVQAGHKEDFGLLIERYEKKLLGYCLRLLRDYDAAEDSVAETFLKAYQNLQSLR